MAAYTTNTFSSNDAKIRWMETYTSDGLNLKATAESHGIVRGFELAGQSPLSVSQFRLLVDPAKGDSVAVLKNANNFCTTVVLGSDVVVDLAASGVAPGEYWVCLWYQYIVGGPQDQPRIVLLTTSELTAAPYVGNIMTLGWVQYLGAVNLDPNPAAGTPNLGVTDYILAVTETPPPTIREIARNYESKGRVQWRNALRTGRADEDVDQTALAEWVQVHTADVDALNTSLTIVDTDPDEGEYHWQARLAGNGVNPLAMWIQRNATPVRGGDIVRFSTRYKVPVAAPGAYFISFGVQFVDKAGAIITQPSGVIVYDAAGLATSWGRAEYMVHVIEGRDIVYMLPTLQITFADPGPPTTVDFYLDDMCVEVLSSDGPQLQSVPDALDSRGQIIRTTVEHIFGPDFTGGPPPTAVDPTIWTKYVSPLDGGVKWQRTAAAASAKAPVIGPTSPGGLLAGGAPGLGANNRRAMYRGNTPRAWATLRWSLGATNFLWVRGHGFDLAIPVVRLGLGHFELTFDIDEDGNDFVINDDFAVELSMMQQVPPPGPASILKPVLFLKGAPAPKTIEVALWGGGLVATTFDPITDGDELYVVVFQDD